MVCCECGYPLNECVCKPPKPRKRPVADGETPSDAQVMKEEQRK